jgi:hypothetical protein
MPSRVAAAVVQERGVGRPGQPPEHGVALVAGAADGVVADVAPAQRARRVVELAAEQLRLEQCGQGLAMQAVGQARHVCRCAGRGVEQRVEVPLEGPGAGLPSGGAPHRHGGFVACFITTQAWPSV